MIADCENNNVDESLDIIHFFKNPFMYEQMRTNDSAEDHARRMTIYKKS